MNARRSVTEGYRYLRGGFRSLLVSKADKDAGTETLLRLYRDRPDLQEVYPEAAKGDFGRLVSWAAGVTQRKWKDSSYEILQQHADVYRETRIPPQKVRVPWTEAVATSQNCSNPLPVTFNVMQQRDCSDISNHLMTLCLLITEFNLRQIVELGTRDGNSTLALLEAARGIGGHVTSVDVEPCRTARERVEQAGYTRFWTFLEGDDMQFAPPQIPQPIDLLFVDTSHIYAPTIAELRKYSAYLSENAWIALHDYVSFSGVNRAVHDFVRDLSPKPRFYSFMHQNGFALLRLPRRSGI